MQDVSEFLKASRKCKKSRENWYADELLELVAHIQEHAENKDISKVEYCEMLDAVIKRANLIKEKIVETLIDSLIYVTEDKSEMICECCGKSCDIEITEKNNNYINACEKCFDRKNRD